MMVVTIHMGEGILLHIQGVAALVLWRSESEG
jgi:hypothetical protein